jgi:PPP family 3-phenylpropionic acid transporter
MALCAGALLLPVPMIGVAVLVVLLGLCFGLAVPLADAGVLREDRAGRLDYGRTRSVGSAAFIAASLAGGAVVARTSDTATVVLMAALALGMLGATLVLPPPPKDAPPRPRPSLKEARALFRSKSFLLMLGAVGLCQGSHAVYYNLAELHWSYLGYSGTTIGLLWSVGVLVEILVLTKGKAVLRRVGPASLIAIGCASAAVRWPLIGLSPPLPVLFALQLLHAGTFTAAFLGSVEFVGRGVPDGYRATAMTVVSTFGVGAVTGVAITLAGQVFDRSDPFAAYASMGAMGAAGLVLALMLRARWDGGVVAALRS